jgi:hypothetical protein
MDAGIDVLQHLGDVDLSTIDRSRQIIKPGPYEVTVEAMETKETKPTEKNPNGGHRLSITVKLNTKAETVENKIVNPGFTLFDSVSLVSTENYNPLERLADIQLATLGTQTKGFVPANFIGKTAIVRVKVEDSDDFGQQNRIARWIPKKVPGSGSDAGAKL